MQEGVIKFTLRFFPYPAVHEKNIQCLNAWRDTLYEYNLIGQDPARYDGAGFGNVSKRCPPFFQPCGKRRFFITGTQTGLKSRLTTDDYTTVLEYNIRQNMITAEGPVKPSSESLTHGAIYDADDNIRYVFHAHSPEIWHNATKLGIPVTHPDVAYGTVEMAQEVKRLFYHSDVAQKQIFSMGGHEDGIITFGRSSQQAGEIMLRYYNLSKQAQKKRHNNNKRRITQKKSEEQMGRSKHNKRRSSGKSYKDLRLCGQVAKALNYALAGECDDDILRDLYVESVLPAPDSSRMLVTVMPNSLPATSAEILERLHLHMNTLMLEVASSIHRRKAPQLKFNVLSKQSLDGISGAVSEDDLYDDDMYDESLSEY